MDQENGANNNDIMINNQDIDMLTTIDLNQQKMNDTEMLDSNGDSLNDDLNDDENNNQELEEVEEEDENNKNKNNQDEEEDNNDDDDDDDSFLLDQETKTPGEILDEFCVKLKDINSTLPETVVNYYMKKSGFIVNDPKLVKIISIASQKFISEIVNDVMQHHKLKSKSVNTQTGSSTLTGSSSSNTAVSSGTSQTNQASSSTSSTTNQKSAINTANTGLTLTLEDLTHVLTEYGINVKKPYYFM